MEKKKVIVRGVIIVLVLLLITYTAFHILTFGVPLSKFAKTQDYTGFSKLSPIKQHYANKEIYSRYTIIGLWTLLILSSLITIFRKKHEESKKISINLPINSKNKTDLDALYEKLKEKKRLKIKDIAKSFNVNEEIVMEWGRILENSNLVSINYPRFGSPELSIEVKNEKQE